MHAARFLLPSLALATWSLSAQADVDRFGNIINEPSSGSYGPVLPILLALAGMVVGAFVLFKVLQRTTSNSTELNVNIAWVAATVIAALVYAAR